MLIKKFDEIRKNILYADRISILDLNNKIKAYKIYAELLDQISKVYHYPNGYIRGELRQKIWDLEKYFGWNNFYSSQSGQDKIIKEVFFRNKKNGFFVEIGAFDGITGSNCFYFEKYLNWDGIAVEPSRIQFAKLQKNRKCKCFNDAISDKIENVDFVEVLEGYVQMSGINSHSYKKTLQVINGNTQNKIQNYSTTTITFNDIVQDNKNIDYLSVDIEGLELQVLNSIKFDDYEIKVLSLENNDQKEINFNKLLQDSGFMYFDTIGVDEIFYNKKYYNF